jgi:hypothetical protein
MNNCFNCDEDFDLTEIEDTESEGDTIKPVCDMIK